MFKRYVFVAVAVFIAQFSPALSAFGQGQQLIEEIEIRGNRRIPRDTILYNIQSKPGDIYSEVAIKRDFEAVVGIGVFDPMKARLSVEDGPRGGKIVVFEVREYPLIRDIQYRNMKSATESEVLTRMKERR